MKVAKKNQVHFASTGRLKHFKSKNQPQKIFANVDATPEHSDANVRERTEKYAV